MTEKQITLAAKLCKILILSRQGLDDVAIKLNCEPTRLEVDHARKWAKAFELAVEGGNVFELAVRLEQEQ